MTNPSFPVSAGDVQPGLYRGVPGSGGLSGGPVSLQPHLPDSAARLEAVPGRVADLAPGPVHQLLLPSHKIQAQSQIFFS